MKTILTASLGAAALVSAPAMAVSGGKLGTLARGVYVCELPGDAASSRGVNVPEASFQVTNASTYWSEKGSGTYLRTGDNVVITSGPKKGERYDVQSERFLRKLDKDGNETGLRCIKLGSTRD